MQNAGRMLGRGTQCKTMGMEKTFFPFFFWFFLLRRPALYSFLFFFFIFFSAALLHQVRAGKKLMSSVRQAPFCIVMDADGFFQLHDMFAWQPIRVCNPNIPTVTLP